MTMRSILQIEGLEVAYGARPTLHGIDLRIDAGQAAGIVGESGSGKSTLAWTVMGLLPPGATITGGSVRFEGIELLTLPAEERRHLRGEAVAMVFQDPFTTLNPCLTIGQQLTEVLIERGLSDARAARHEGLRLMDEVQLPRAVELFDAYPHQLSGGMKQRIVIASALACSPRLLVLDEPTTALDVTVEARILQLLAELQATRGLSMLFISHNLGIVEQICSSVTVMQSGQVVETGATRDVLFRPGHAYTRKLLGALPRLARASIASSPEALPTRAADSARTDSEGLDVPVIEAKGVGLTFGGGAGWLSSSTSGVRALDDVSLSLRRGEIVGLVGESGSGKSTLGRCLIGIYAPQVGQISIDGQSRGRAGGNADHRIQMVFQNPDSSLNPRHRIGPIIGRPLRLIGLSQREANERVAELLTLVSLPTVYVDRYPHQLSGGEKQRIGIARALAVDPEVLICDEVTSALDVSVQATILDLVRDLRDRLKVAILFISHDLAVISQISDRIVVMKSGRIVEEGTASRIIHSPREPYTQELLASVPPFISGVARPGAGGSAQAL
jgi:peptide/nickel transport system ATP-binding protein